MDTIGVNLQILTSQLAYFDKLTSIKKKNGFKSEIEKDTILNQIAKIDNNEIKSFLEDEFNNIEVNQSSTGSSYKQETISLDDLSKVNFNFANVSKYQNYENEILADNSDKKTTVKQRIDALETTRKCLNNNSFNGQLRPARPDSTNLSTQQQDALRDIFENYPIGTISNALKKGGTDNNIKFNSIQDFINYCKKRNRK